MGKGPIGSQTRGPRTNPSLCCPLLGIPAHGSPWSQNQRETEARPAPESKGRPMRPVESWRPESNPSCRFLAGPVPLDLGVLACLPGPTHPVWIQAGVSSPEPAPLGAQGDSTTPWGVSGSELPWGCGCALLLPLGCALSPACLSTIATCSYFLSRTEF